MGFQIEIALHVADREQVTELRIDAEHARAEAAEHLACAEVVGDLLGAISHQADENLLGQDLRSAQSKWKSTPFRYWVSGSGLKVGGVNEEPFSGLNLNW